jgi:hypothetical protein
MENVNIFERASRLKIRFAFKGLLTIEDLWDLSLEHLDELYGLLTEALDGTKRKSLLNKKTEADERLALSVEIVTQILRTKQGEAEANKNRAAKAARRRELTALLADKQNEELRGKSAEEIQKMLEELE